MDSKNHHINSTTRIKKHLQENFCSILWYFEDTDNAELPKPINIQLLLYKTTTCLTQPVTTFFCPPNEKKLV